MEHWYDILQYEPYRLISLLCSVVWVIIGPILGFSWFRNAKSLVNTIDHYVKPTQNDLYFDKRIWFILRLKGKSRKNKKEKEEIILPSCKVIMRHEIEDLQWRNIIISFVWVGVIVFILICPSGSEALKNYYFFGYDDWNYWRFIICVAYVALQTSWFIIFLLISKHLIINITKKEVAMSKLLLNYGRQNNLSLLGNFISKTTLCFCSGLFFFPIMITIFKDSLSIKNNATGLVFALMGIYIVLILLYLISMNKYVIESAQKFKEIILDKMTIEQAEIEDGSLREFTLDQRIRYVSKLNVNPLEADQYLKLMYGFLMSVFLPTIFALLLK